MYSKICAYLLWFFSGFGVLGFHRFYLGKIPSGLLWMFTGGLAFLGALYDFFTLGAQVDVANAHAALYDRSRNYDRNINYGNSNTRYAQDAFSKIIDSDDIFEKDSTERRILKTARKNKGIITPSILALDANISLDDAKKQLEDLVKKGHAEMRVKSNGTIVFTFADFMEDNSSGFEDL
ncbi:MAG: hypothetical protein Ta2G_14610 [Termitinemataceae bacterium]|nr:MAG: hypothetical protein Ta2G_14610 [Termitinemataceae bacterium]